MNLQEENIPTSIRKSKAGKNSLILKTQLDAVSITAFVFLGLFMKKNQYVS